MCTPRTALTIVAVATLAASVTAQTITLQPKPGAPVSGLTAAELSAFELGKQQFDRVFQVSDGLGPIFNQNSCASCHSNPVGGSGTILVQRFGYLDPKSGIFDPLTSLGGSLRQSQSITAACQETIPAIANVVASRVTNSILGAGLVEAIPDSEITGNAANQPTGLGGQVHMVPTLEDPNAPLRPGRFGWKAQLTTVLSFSGDASQNELGLTNRLLPTENAPNGNQAVLATCDSVPDPEDAVVPGTGLEFIDHVTNFQRYLAAPPQTPQSGMTGESLFTQVGCTDCHRPSYTTSNSAALEPALRNQAIKPYSDYLIHDMGAAADFIEQGGAGPQRIRTPSLWGVRTRNALWHDGRVSGPDLATRILGPGGIIELHNAFASKAATSAQAFLQLSSSDQMKVVDFLDSLGKVEFDGDGDGDVDSLDLQGFFAVQTAPGSNTYTADDPEAVYDVDQDGDVDNVDFDHMVYAYTEDCNGNGVGDLIDILINGTSTDVNNNYIPDECEFCQPDLGSQFGNPTLTICGDDLTQPGSAAAVIIDNTPANQVVQVAISITNNPLTVFPGAVVIPGLPWADLISVTTDSNGRFVTPLYGGPGSVFTYYVQGGYIVGTSVELTNAVAVSIGN